MDGDRDLLRVEEAAARLGLGRATTWALIGRGELAVCRVGHRTLVPVTALRAFIEAHTSIVATADEEAHRGLIR